MKIRNNFSWQWIIADKHMVLDSWLKNIPVKGQIVKCNIELFKQLMKESIHTWFKHILFQEQYIGMQQIFIYILDHCVALLQGVHIAAPSAEYVFSGQ